MHRDPMSWLKKMRTERIEDVNVGNEAPGENMHEAPQGTGEDVVEALGQGPRDQGALGKPRQIDDVVEALVVSYYMASFALDIKRSLDNYYPIIGNRLRPIIDHVRSSIEWGLRVLGEVNIGQLVHLGLAALILVSREESVVVPEAIRKNLESIVTKAKEALRALNEYR